MVANAEIRVAWGDLMFRASGPGGRKVEVCGELRNCGSPGAT
jgi:hypothetical protein